ncbi:hypothetical protein BGZ68_001784 [Mortierella alpina]|nr:hypothetical protein BGZ68_001784 [Mortierella alpina]
MASANPFDLLNDDAQDQEIHIPAVKKAAKPSAPKPAAASAPKATTTDNKGPRKATARPSQPKDNDIPRGPRYDRAPREGDAAPRAPGGSRAPRGGRGGARGGRHGGYDRHSGTGKVDSENKENNRLGDPTAAALEGEKDAALTAVESGAATPELVEPEAVVKTLDDYLQERAAKALKISLPKARAANSGADDSQWKDAKLLEVEETGDFIKMGKESVAKSRKGKKESKILITDIDVRYAEPAREQSAPRSAFRGGRGGDRPRGGRGGSSTRGGSNATPGPRRSAPGGSNVNVNDTELFPSLGSQ